jgi:hypothetical protein
MRIEIFDGMGELAEGDESPIPIIQLSFFIPLGLALLDDLTKPDSYALPPQSTDVSGITRAIEMKLI